MTRSNNNQGNNPIWTDNSDRNFSVITPLMSTPPEAQPEGAGEATNRARQVRQILRAIAKETARLGQTIVQRLIGQGKV